MKAYYQNLRWVKGTVELKQGPFYSVPDNVVIGSNNTYIFPDPAKLYFTVVTDSNEYITENIIDTVKFVNGWKKMSQKRYDTLERKLSSVSEYHIDSDGRILNLGFYAKV